MNIRYNELKVFDMKKVILISGLIPVFLLSACSLTNLFKKKEGFKDKGEEVSYSVFIEKLREEEMKKGFDNMMESEVPSFTAINEESYQHLEVKTQDGKKVEEKEDNRNYKTTFKYDENNLLISMDHTAKLNISGTSSVVTKNTQYEIEDNDLVYLSKIDKTYTTNIEYIGRGKTGLKNQAYWTIMQSFADYTYFNENTKFYINNNIYTVTYERNEETDQTDDHFTAKEEYKCQMTFKDSEWYLIMKEENIYKHQYQDGSTLTYETRKAYTSKITYKKVTLKHIDISGYTEIQPEPEIY